MVNIFKKKNNNNQIHREVNMSLKLYEHKTKGLLYNIGHTSKVEFKNKYK